MLTRLSPSRQTQLNRYGGSTSAKKTRTTYLYMNRCYQKSEPLDLIMAVTPGLSNGFEGL